MKYLTTPRIAYALTALVLVTGAQFDSPVFAAGQPLTTPPASPASASAPLSQESSDSPSADTQGTPDSAAPAAGEVECMAKVVMHEAGNQPRRGQIAVAQVIRTRMKVGGGQSACDVVRQPGQFFNVDRFSPSRVSAAWRNAVEIATTTLKGEGEEIVPGAMFFHTAGHPMKGRLRIAQIDNHVFYR